jgi:hypothetical protein
MMTDSTDNRQRAAAVESHAARRAGVVETGPSFVNQSYQTSSGFFNRF